MQWLWLEGAMPRANSSARRFGRTRDEDMAYLRSQLAQLQS
jgi:hypothetical protein